MVNKLKNYIMRPHNMSCGAAQTMLETIGVSSTLFDLGGTLMIDQEGKCSWSIKVDTDKTTTFFGLGFFLPTYDERNRLEFVNFANAGAGLCRFFLLGERTLGVSYTLKCTNGVPTQLFLDSWEALMEEQKKFEDVLEEIPQEDVLKVRQKQCELEIDNQCRPGFGKAVAGQDPFQGLRNFMLGCLWGGAIGDVLGAPVEFLSWEEIVSKHGPRGTTHFHEVYGGYGKVTDDTQMTLFTLEAMIRCRMRSYDHGMVNPADVFFYAYLRWAKTQGESIKDFEVYAGEYLGWLFSHKELHQRRGPDNTCISALQDANTRGTVGKRINNSKGSGGLMRAAPAGFFDVSPGAFELGCQLAAVTHGHPTGFLSAGFLAELIAQLRNGYSLLTAIFLASVELKKHEDHQEVAAAVAKAVDLASSPEDPQLQIQRLGEGWNADEVLAISIYCALKDENFYNGMFMAVNHSGDSDTIGAITGNILGAIYGYEVVVDSCLNNIEYGNLMIEMVDDAINIFEHGRDLDDFLVKYPPC